MDYSKLKEEIREIADIAASVPDRFKEKCFEVLLGNLISGTANDIGGSSQQEGPPPPPPPGRELPITTQLRVFMRRRKITEDALKVVLMVADGEAHFLSEPTPQNTAEGQTQWALLLALKNGVLNNSLEADPEEVRSICQDKGLYDPANFAAHFKKAKFAKLFKGLMEPQGDPQRLTTDGETELATLIAGLGSQSQ